MKIPEQLEKAIKRNLNPTDVILANKGKSFPLLDSYYILIKRDENGKRYYIYQFIFKEKVFFRKFYIARTDTLAEATEFFMRI